MFSVLFPRTGAKGDRGRRKTGLSYQFKTPHKSSQRTHQDVLHHTEGENLNTRCLVEKSPEWSGLIFILDVRFCDRVPDRVSSTS